MKRDLRQRPERRRSPHARVVAALAAAAAVAMLSGCAKRGTAAHDDHSDHEHHGAVAARNESADKLMCGEHGVPEEECGICHPELAARLAPGQSLKVRMPSTNSAAIAGIETAAPQVGPVAESIECYAEIGFNQNAVAHVTAPVSGVIQEVAADLGMRAAEGQTLARIWSAGIAEAVAKAVLTHQTLERERKLRSERVTSERDLQQAEAEHRAACQQLRTLGFTEDQIHALSDKPQESVLLEVRAPFAGEIVERTAVRGGLVEAGKALFTLADRSVMWATLHIPEAELLRVHTGQTVELTVESLAGQSFTGKLTWIAPEIDERSRMARARAEIMNRDGRLMARMFARARIVTGEASGKQGALLIPSSAIQRVDGKPVVFVQAGPGLFEARAVRTGAKVADQVQVLAGLTAADEVVVDHAFALKSSLLASRLGASCADD